MNNCVDNIIWEKPVKEKRWRFLDDVEGGITKKTAEKSAKKCARPDSPALYQDQTFLIIHFMTA